MARKPLGRGLSALLGEDSQTKDNDQPEKSEGKRVRAREMEISRITANPMQPRGRFEDKALDELAASITANGIIQPILVRSVGLKYQIIAGERRWRAAQRAGLHTVPVIINEVTDEKILEIALIENIQREE